MKGIVVGASAGGIASLNIILPKLPQTFAYPIFIAQHIPEDMPVQFIELLDEKCAMKVKEANHNEQAQAGYVYFAPAGYHLLIEAEGIISLSVDDRVNYSRPSIDVLFQSAAEVYKSQVLGIILSGANHDGVMGAKTIINFGGKIWVQSPETAESNTLPEKVKSELNLSNQDCYSLEEIANGLVQLTL